MSELNFNSETEFCHELEKQMDKLISVLENHTDAKQLAGSLRSSRAGLPHDVVAVCGELKWLLRADKSDRLDIRIKRNSFFARRVYKQIDALHIRLHELSLYPQMNGNVLSQ